MELQYNSQPIEFAVARSRRKTISIYVHPDGKIVVKAPLRVSDKELQRLLSQKAKWMYEKQQEALKKAEQKSERVFTDEEIKIYKKKAKEQIQKRVEYYSAFIPESTKINRIMVKEQKKRWGSCSSKGNLNFNWRLILAPPEVLDYVVVHEMCHLKYMNHSKEFWCEVERILPDYKERRKWLKEKGTSLEG